MAAVEFHLGTVTRSTMPPLDLTIGVDVGQKRDPTAIAVARREKRERKDQPGKFDDHYIVHALESLALGTPYGDVGRRVANVTEAVAALTSHRPKLYVDATGVGQPLVDALAEAGVRAHATIIAVYFTHGDRLTENPGEMSLGKGYLVGRLQALLEHDRLHLPNTPDAKKLAQELKDYEIRVDEQANDRYGAFKVGTHDDLVTAVGLAVVVKSHTVDFW